MSAYRRKKISIPLFELTPENEKEIKGLPKCVIKANASFDSSTISGVERIYRNAEKIVLILKH